MCQAVLTMHCPPGNGERVVPCLQRKHHPGWHRDELAVAAPASGAEDLQAFAEIRPPPGAPGASSAAVLLQRGHERADSHRRNLGPTSMTVPANSAPRTHGNSNRHRDVPSRESMSE